MQTKQNPLIQKQHHQKLFLKHRILPTDKVSTDDIILYSSAACVIDVDSGEILYYKNMDDRHYPASITKVLTGLLLIENANLDDTISRTCTPRI